MADISTYKIPAPGDLIERRILRPTTDDLTGGYDVWILQCGDSKTNIDNVNDVNALTESDEPESEPDQMA